MLSSKNPFLVSPAFGVLDSSSVPRRASVLFGVWGIFGGIAEEELVIVEEAANENGLFNEDLEGLLKDSSREPKDMSGIVLLDSCDSSPRLLR